LLDLRERSGPVLAATVHLAQGSSVSDPLYRMIPDRHTNRYAYDPARPVPATWRAGAERMAVGYGAHIAMFDTGKTRDAFSASVIDATRAIIADKAMIADSDRWFRSTQGEIEVHRDGPALKTAGLTGFTLLLAELLPVSPEISHQGWLNQTEMQLRTAPLVGLIAVRDRYDGKEALAAGRLWQRLHLSAVASGIAMQPLNQPIEMVDRARQSGHGPQWHERMASLTGTDWEATFSFRAGYPTHDAPPSARRRLKDVVMV
jgi:hypothetical protein